MSLGKKIRLARLFAHSSGRLCSIAVDHFAGYCDGIPEGLRDLPRTIAQIVAGGPDAITMHLGTATGCWGPHAGKLPLIIQSIFGRPDDTCDEYLATPEDAVRLGADAFATCAFVRGKTEDKHVRRVADFVRQARPWDMPVILHTDGDVRKLIPGLIAAGIDCLQPCEAKAGMDLVELKANWGDKLAFMGGIDVRAMADPDPAVIEREISRKLPVAKQGGGYIYHADHSVPDNVSFEQYQRVMELVREYGGY